MTRKAKITELGAEIQCSNCKEFYPADTEFYAYQKKGLYGCHCYCRACHAAKSREHRQKQEQKNAITANTH